MNTSTPSSESTATPKKDPAGIWPTFWAFVPYEEASIALKAAGTNGFAVYTAICIQRFLTAPKHRAAFYCSQHNLAAICGISDRRLRQPLRQLEAAKLVKIARPQGIDKVNHQAAKITLLPVFVNGNEIKRRPDKASGSKRTKRPVESGHELGSNLSVNAELPLTGVTHAAALNGASVDAPTAADESRDEPRRYTTVAMVTADLINDGSTKTEAEQDVNGMIADGTLINNGDGRLYWKTS